MLQENPIFIAKFIIMLELNNKVKTKQVKLWHGKTKTDEGDMSKSFCDLDKYSVRQSVQ
jgi:hypothetical protein